MFLFYSSIINLINAVHSVSKSTKRLLKFMCFHTTCISVCGLQNVFSISCVFKTEHTRNKIMYKKMLIARKKKSKNPNCTSVVCSSGRHRCIGENFAYVQIKTIWSTMLRMYEFDLVDGYFPTINYTTMIHTPHNPVIRYKRRKQ